jgi:phage gpG-like protein
MSVAISIQLSPAAQKIAANLQKLPAQAALIIASAMDEANQFALANIVEKHLTGKGPYPVDEKRLGERSHLLRNSARTTAAVVENDKVISGIGSNVKYAGLHEFGGRITIPARQVKVRLRTNADGSLMRQLGQLAIFAKKKHKRAKEVVTQSEAYDVVMPERAPFRTGITEMAPRYSKSISAAIIAAIKP